MTCEVAAEWQPPGLVVSIRIRLSRLAHAARCVARHAVGSHAEPPTIECAWPVT